MSAGDPDRSHLGVLLTAYADGALSEDGCAFIERQLEEHPELRDRLGEIRAAQEALRAHLPPAPARLDEARRAALRVAAAAKPEPRRRWLGPVTWLAAACLVAAVTVATLPNLLVVRAYARPASAPAVATGGDRGYGIAPNASDRDLGQAPVRIAATPAPSPIAGWSGVGGGGYAPGAAPAAPAPAPPDGGVLNGLAANEREGLLKFKEADGEGRRDAAGGRIHANGKVAAIDVPAAAEDEEAAKNMPRGREEALSTMDKDGRVFRSGGAKKSDADKRRGLAAAEAPAERKLQAALPMPATTTRPAPDLAAREGAAQERKTVNLSGITTGGEQLDQATTASGPSAPAVAAKPLPSPPPAQIGQQNKRFDSLGRAAGADRARDGVPRQLGAALSVPLDRLASRAEKLQDKQQMAAERIALGATYAPLPPAELNRLLAARQPDNIAMAQQQRLGSLADLFADRWEELADFADQPAGQLEQQQQQLSDRSVAESRLPIRLLVPDRAAVQVPLLAGSLGENLLAIAARNRVQLVPEAGGIAVQGADAALDPTATFGLERDDFRVAFGSAPMQAVATDGQQTFAIDASTSSFDAARAALDAGRLPDPLAIEPQHAYNAVPADYPAASGEDAFQLYAEAGPAPFARGPFAARTALVALGVVSRPAAEGERLPLDLVVALDASGSMGRPGGLDRARAGLSALLPQLDARDRVAVVAFGDVARVALPAIAGDHRQAIAEALGGVRADGSTNLADGLGLAYQMAGELAAPGRSCRVLLITDGAALAGDSAPAAEAAVARWRGRGVSLLIVGCAGEAYDGAALERLAQRGDGEHVVAASDDAARALFTSRLLPARLAILARDAKVQVTWNPQRVAWARLIGFEKRRLAHEQFRDDRVDAGELAQDSRATALFEVILDEHGNGALGTAAVRYLDTRLGKVVELARPLPGGLVATAASPRLRLLACAAELGETMQCGWWRNARGDDHDRLASELARLDAPFARVLERMDQRFRELEGQDKP